MDTDLIRILLSAGVLVGCLLRTLAPWAMKKTKQPFDPSYLASALYGGIAAIITGSIALPSVAPDISIIGALAAGVPTGFMFQDLTQMVAQRLNLDLEKEKDDENIPEN